MGYPGQVWLTHKKKKKKKIESIHVSTCFCFGSKKLGLSQVFFGLGHGMWQIDNG